MLAPLADSLIKKLVAESPDKYSTGQPSKSERHSCYMYLSFKKQISFDRRLFFYTYVKLMIFFRIWNTHIYVLFKHEFLLKQGINLLVHSSSLKIKFSTHL